MERVIRISTLVAWMILTMAFAAFMALWLAGCRPITIHVAHAPGCTGGGTITNQGDVGQAITCDPVTEPTDTPSAPPSTPDPVVTPSPEPSTPATPDPVVTPSPGPPEDEHAFVYPMPEDGHDAWLATIPCPLPDPDLGDRVNEEMERLTGCPRGGTCKITNRDFVQHLIEGVKGVTPGLRGATTANGQRVWVGIHPSGNTWDTFLVGTERLVSVHLAVRSGSDLVRWWPSNWCYSENNPACETRVWHWDGSPIPDDPQDPGDPTPDPNVCGEPTPPPLFEIACHDGSRPRDCVPRVRSREYCDSQGFVNRNECPPRGEPSEDHPNDRVACERLLFGNVPPHARVLDGDITITPRYEDNAFNLFDVGGSGRWQLCNADESVCSAEMVQ